MAPTASVAASTIPNPADLKAAMKAANEPAVAPTETVEAPVAEEVAFDASSLFTSDKAANATTLIAFTALIQKDGPSAFTKSSFTKALKQAIVDKKSPAMREAAVTVILALSQDASVNKSFEVYFIQETIINDLLEAFADKMPAVRNAAV